PGRPALHRGAAGRGHRAAAGDVGRDDGGHRRPGTNADAGPADPGTALAGLGVTLLADGGTALAGGAVPGSPGGPGTAVAGVAFALVAAAGWAAYIMLSASTGRRL